MIEFGDRVQLIFVGPCTPQATAADMAEARKQLQLALTADDWMCVRRCVHKLKGASATAKLDVGCVITKLENSLSSSVDHGTDSGATRALALAVVVWVDEVVAYMEDRRGRHAAAGP